MTERVDCNCQIIASLVRYHMYDPRTIEELLKVLKELTSTRFFGELLMKFESGHIAYLRKTEALRL